MKKYDVVVAGYFCIDMVPDFKQNESGTNLSNYFLPGKLIEIDGMSLILGGVVANTGLALKKFNRRVFLNGLVGDDFMGNVAKDLLEKYGVSEGIHTTTLAGTAFSIVIAPPGVDRIFLESPGCNQIFDKNFINFNAVSQSRLFHFGYPPLLKQFFQNNGDRLVDLFAEVQRMGLVTSLDFSLPDPDSESATVNWPELMKCVLPFTDIFAPSLEESLKIFFPSKYAELQLSYGDSDIPDHTSIDLIRFLGKHILDLGVKILIIKMAHRGIYLLTGDVSSINEKEGFNLPAKSWNFREMWFEGYPADESKIINSTGAGDTAIAAFLSAILGGNSPESSIKYAAMAGKNNLYCHNIYEEISGWPEMTKEINSCHIESNCYDSELSNLLN